MSSRPARLAWVTTAPGGRVDRRRGGGRLRRRGDVGAALDQHRDQRSSAGDDQHGAHDHEQLDGAQQGIGHGRPRLRRQRARRAHRGACGRRRAARPVPRQAAAGNVALAPAGAGTRGPPDAGRPGDSRAGAPGKTGRARRAVACPSPAPAEPAAEPRALEILFEDEHLLVLVKPAGHRGPPGPGPSARAPW